MEPITDEDLTSGPPSGETEPGTPGRRKATAIVAAIGGALAVIVVAIALVLSSSQDGATPKKLETVTQSGPPASQLEQNPQSEKLGSDGS